MNVLHTIGIANWNEAVAPEARAEAAEALESGMVLYFPQLAFVLEEKEQVLLTPDVSDGQAKNVSLRPDGELRGTSCGGEAAALMKTMIERFRD